MSALVAGSQLNAANMTEGIKPPRTDKITKQGSVHDVIHAVCGKPGNYANQVFSRLNRAYPELTPKWCKLKIDGKGKATPVADAATLVEIAWLCTGKVATGRLLVLPE